ncbi:MAG: protein tyrosine phosphatase, partial [Proteobacteria bacterium]|nr:protein tyrosine phosphatase [Pseudomonadota bacterium]
MPRNLPEIAIAALLLVAPLAPLRAAEPVKLAFVDTGNTGRSVTAEA